MYFTEEHNLFRESLKDFLQKEVVPHIEEWEESGKINKAIWTKFGEMGFFGLMTPEAYPRGALHRSQGRRCGTVVAS